MKNDNMKNLLQGMNMAKLQDDEDIRLKIIVREEFKSLIPELSATELAQLEENILLEGVRDPIILWQVEGQFVIVDGHNRFSICQKHGLEFPFKKVVFKNDEEVKSWMVKNQLGRRNLSKETQSYLRGLQYNQEKGRGRGDDSDGAQSGPMVEGRTADRLAEEHNMSKNTIKRDGLFAIGIDLIADQHPEIKRDILLGKSKIMMKDIQDVGQHKKTIGQLFDKDKKKEAKRKLRSTPESISEIAFLFIKEEKRSVDELCKILEMESPPRPVEFFIKWSVLRDS